MSKKEDLLFGNILWIAVLICGTVFILSLFSVIETYTGLCFALGELR
jgi:hypothetical protein